MLDKSVQSTSHILADACELLTRTIFNAMQSYTMPLYFATKVKNSFGNLAGIKNLSTFATIIHVFLSCIGLQLLHLNLFCLSKRLYSESQNSKV